MSDVAVARKKFLEALASIAAGDSSADELTDVLRIALLDFASETPDNLKAAAGAEVGLVDSTVGLKVVGRKLLLSEIAHAVEDLPMPEALKASFPDMSECDWDTFTRLTTLIYLLLSHSSSAKA